MEEQFVPYELALKLKELGFDEKCFGWWSYINGTAASFYGYHCTNSELLELNSFNKNCTAPLWQQASDWFRDKGYHSFTELQDNTREYYWYNTIQDSNDREFNDQTMVDSSKNIWLKEKFDTFEEARLRRLEELIKIVEKNKS